MTAIDWSRPIEAVHPDGRVIAVIAGDIDDDGYHHVSGPIDWMDGYHRPDGVSHVSGDLWRIRNVQPPTPERDPALWDRMEALVREMASKRWQLADNENYQEARAIVADLPKPVDPDLIEARDLLSHSFVPQDDESEKLVLRAIKRGGELAGEQA